MGGETIAGLVGPVLGVLGLLTYNKLRVRTAKDQAEVLLEAGATPTTSSRGRAHVKEEALRRREALDAEAEEARKGFREQEDASKNAPTCSTRNSNSSTRKSASSRACSAISPSSRKTCRRNARGRQLLVDQREMLHRHRPDGPGGGPRAAPRRLNRRARATRSAA